MVAADKVAGDRHSVVRASWRRRALVDTLVDELALFQGAGGERERLGRRRHEQGLSGGRGG